MNEKTNCISVQSVPSVELNWQHWFARWEAMQSAYLPQREHRFDLMFCLPEFLQDAKLRILDLGCGPGSVTFCALQHYPNAHIIAVDADPVLLEMGREIELANYELQIANRRNVEFIQADLRDGNWWEDYEGAFDLVVSATALHWLSAGHLRETYRRVYCALKPGGWFFNADHIASDDPVTQAHYRQLLREWQQANFDTGVEDWDGFWQGFEAAVNQPELFAQREEVEYWEGSDDGNPKLFHITTLRECGFTDVAIHWQDLGEALIGARKS
ncbi:MAG: class I SAM-dependent methyltransferase [Anaerolineae bacterium]|nr:class I SAM-dependent methyltransferase [Anaerolineae bacterium]